MKHQSNILSERKVRQITESRVRYITILYLEKDFIEKYKDVIENISEYSEVFINVNESGIIQNSTTTNTKYVVFSSQKNGYFVTSNTLSTLSVVIFIETSGHTLLVIHVMINSLINEEVDDIIVENDKIRSG